MIPLLSRESVIRLANGAGWLAFRLSRRDRRIALANLDLAFGETLSKIEKRRLVQRSFTSFVLTGLDYFWFSCDREKRLRDWVVVHNENWPWMRREAMVAVTAHYGNWEVLGWLTISNGATVGSVAKPVKNPLIDAEVNRLRTQSGQVIVPREGALKSLVRILKGGGTVALLLDQDTLPAEGGAFVPFFGVPVPISTAGAGLALKLKIPILMAYCTSDAKGVYHCYAREFWMPEDIRDLSAEQVTARIAASLELQIRNEPAYWLWSYKRWKRRLPGFDPARYPFYADC